MIYFANQGTLLLKHIINGRNINALVSSSEHFFFFCCVACGILVPRPGIELVPPALEAWVLNHWTTREVPLLSISCLATTGIIPQISNNFPAMIKNLHIFKMLTLLHVLYSLLIKSRKITKVLFSIKMGKK